MRKRSLFFLAALLNALILSVCGCAASPSPTEPDAPAELPASVSLPLPAPAASPEDAPEATPPRELSVDYNARTHTSESPSSDKSESPECAEAEEAQSDTAASVEETLVSSNERVIVIDPGHQAQGNYDTEPLGPGSSEMKIKVSGGTASCNTGAPESELVLSISLLLQTELESRGYTVYMTRTTQDVDLSNVDRAEFANDANADAFLRIHANGSDSSEMSGAMTLCQTSSNPFHAALYPASYALSAAILEEMVAATDCRKLYVWETDTMTGINWSLVPVTIVEVGFMTNPEEDRLLATQAYQEQLAVGIANGLDRFFEEQTAQE